jgi:hypothetical protein
VSKIFGKSYSDILEYYSEKTKAEQRAKKRVGVDTLGEPIDQEIKSGCKTVYPTCMQSEKNSLMQNVFQKIN